jgi:hypothetical protein
MKIVLLFLLVLLQEAQPELTVDVGSAEPNQVVVIRITVSNPNTADLLWENILRIEEVHPFLVPVKSECELSNKIWPGDVNVGELSVQVRREAEAGQYPVSITLSGGVGACEEGCVPYFIEKEALIKVVRDEPEIKITHTLQEASIIITLNNVGSGKAQNIACDGSVLDILLPGEKEKIVIENRSTFTIMYEDKYGKEFSYSYRISESKPENDSSVQSVLVGIGIILAYLFKRSKG